MENDRVERVFALYGKLIMSLAYTYLHDMAEAEDILQDTLVKYILRAEEFNDGQHEKLWLLNVAANLCRNRLKQKKRVTDELPEDFPGEGIPEDSLDLMRAVSSLPLKYREVVHLFYYDDMPAADIAGVLEKPEATVRSLLSRARKMLREKLGQADGGI